MTRLIKPDLILLDINMPRMSGFDFLDEAINLYGKSFRAIVVVMLTTSLHPDDVERAKQYNVIFDYIPNPLTVEKFHQIVEQFKAGPIRDWSPPADPNAVFQHGT